MDEIEDLNVYCDDLVRSEKAVILTDGEAIHRSLLRGIPERLLSREDDGGVVIKRDLDVSAAFAEVFRRASTKMTGIPERHGNDVLTRAAKRKGITVDDEMLNRFVVRHVASTTCVDAYGSIILQNFELDEAERNGPLLFSHAWDSPPLGRMLTYDVVRGVTVGGQKRDALIVHSLFADPGDNEAATRVWNLVRSNFMTAVSIGARILELMEIRDEKERKKLGLGRWGFVIKRSRLKELSVVPMPGNPEVAKLSDAAEKKQVELADVQWLREAVRLAAATEEDFKQADTVLRAALQTIFRHRAPAADIGSPIVQVRSEERVEVEPETTEERIGNIERALARIEANFPALIVTLTDEVQALREAVSGGAKPPKPETEERSEDTEEQSDESAIAALLFGTTGA